MMTLSKTTSETALQYGKFPMFAARIEGHVPFNKKSWQIASSTANLEVVRCVDGGLDGEGWLHIEMTECTQAKKDGPFQSRTISIDLHGDDARKLIAMLQEAA